MAPQFPVTWANVVLSIFAVLGAIQFGLQIAAPLGIHSLPLQRRQLAENEVMKIPRILHQVYIAEQAMYVKTPLLS